MAIVKKYNLTLNNDKYSYRLSTLYLLGYVISKETMALDPELLAQAHYPLWVFSVFEKIHLLTRVTSLLLIPSFVKSFVALKMDIAKSAIMTVNNTIFLVVETGISNYYCCLTEVI